MLCDTRFGCIKVVVTVDMTSRRYYAPTETCHALMLVRIKLTLTYIILVHPVPYAFTHPLYLVHNYTLFDLSLEFQSINDIWRYSNKSNS